MDDKCDCGHFWEEHDTFRNGYGDTSVICCHIDNNVFCSCRVVVLKDA